MRAFIVFAIAVLLGAPACLAQTTLRATFGWGDAVRLGWWTPIYVSVMDPQTRPVILQVAGQQGLSLNLIVRQEAVVQPQSTLYEVLYPLGQIPSKIVVTVIDRATGKTLAWQRLEDPVELTRKGQQPHKLLGGGAPLIGVCSEAGDAAELRQQMSIASLVGGFQPPLRLPANAVGYDGVAVLMLDGIHLGDLEGAQEQAMLDWVSAGGNLLVWPGIDPVPERDAVVAALPCDIGVKILADAPRGATTQPSQWNGRQLSPRPGAEAMHIFSANPSLPAYTRRYGLGRITVLPVDLSGMQIGDGATARAFWRQILAGMIEIPEPKTPSEVPDSIEDIVPSDHPTTDDPGGRQTLALRHLQQAIGNPSQTERNWSAIFLIIAGFMFVAGPFDSVLLFRLGREPRSWVTIIGWIGLIVCTAGYLLTHAPSGQPHLKTIRFIDQINDRTIAQTDLVLIASTHPQTIALALDPLIWWRTVRPGELPRDQFTDVDFIEDRKENLPRSLQLDAGESIGLLGERVFSGEPVMSAELSIKADHLVGSITNLSKASLSNINVATSKGSYVIVGEIAPGATINIDQGTDANAVVQSDLPADVNDLTPVQSDRIGDLVRSGGYANISARSSGAIAPKVIDGVDAENHWELIQAVVAVLPVR